MALTNSQYESILRDYDEIRDENRRLLEAKKERVRRAVPAYSALEDSVSALSVSAAKAFLAGDDKAREELHAALAETALRKKALLTEAGFPEDYLEPVYRCPLCLDTGYVSVTGQPKQKCACFRQREISILYFQSHIQDLIKRDHFAALSYDYYHGEDLLRFEAAVKSVEDLVQNFDQGCRNILFYGTVGTGKSFLSCCAAKELIDRGRSVVYFSAPSFFDLLAQHSFGRREREPQTDLCEDLYGCDLLILDDLGTEITNSFVASQLFSCLNERGLRKRPTIISTNLCLEELRDRYSDRIFSRITSSFSLCKLTGPDIRIYKKRVSKLKDTD